MVLTFTGLTNHHARGAAIKSLLVTAVAGTPAVLSVYPYRVTDGDAVVAIAATAGSTCQVFFDRLPISSGLTVVADAGVLSYVVEYDDL